MATDQPRSADDLDPDAPGGPDVSPAKAPRWPNDDGVRVALWGPSGSGKTTFLWALLAADDRKRSASPWRVSPYDAEARRINEAVFSGMSLKGSLPNETLALEQPSAWILSRDPAAPRKPPRGVPEFLRGRREEDEEIRVLVHLQDVPGVVFDFENREADAFREAAVRQLADADAFIYLHDPLTDADSQGQQSAVFFRRMLDTIEARRPGELTGRRLEQHVAVCVTKFDHPVVFDPAYQNGFVLAEPAPGTSRARSAPEISGKNARAYFDWLCEHHAYYRRTELVRKDLHTRFHQDRVRYYATSSLGFFRRDDGSYNLRDLRNEKAGAGLGATSGTYAQSPVEPVNVLEPFVDLVQAMRRIPPGHGARRGTPA
ncbi:hypothetical protein [Streptomyces sp. SD15]